MQRDGGCQKRSPRRRWRFAAPLPGITAISLARRWDWPRVIAERRQRGKVVFALCLCLSAKARLGPDRHPCPRDHTGPCWRQSRSPPGRASGLLAIGTWANKSTSCCPSPALGLVVPQVWVRRAAWVRRRSLVSRRPWSAALQTCRQRQVSGRVKSVRTETAMMLDTRQATGRRLHGPVQATAPPPCWSKPSRTPADSDRWPVSRVWLQDVPSPPVMHCWLPPHARLAF